MTESKPNENLEFRPMVEMRSASVNAVNFTDRTITVIAVPYESPGFVEYRGQAWREMFSRGAFAGIETRQRRIPVTAQLKMPNPGVSHDHSGASLVGRVATANPDHQDGLVVEMRISKTADGDAALELADDDALAPSVGFALQRLSDQVLEKRTMTRRINRAFLDHVALVGQPAYTDARVLSVRSGVSGGELPALAATPRMDEFLNDPVFSWMADRFRP